MPIPAAAIGAAANAAKLVTNLVNNSKAKREARKLEASRPIRETSPLVQQELDLAESELASGGLSAKAERAYNQLNDKQFSASLGAILRGGGSVNNVGDVFGAGEEGRLRLALMNDQMRVDQLNRLSKAREQSAEEADKNFMFNIVAPWKDKVQAVSKARQQATEGIWNSIDNIGAMGMQLAGQQYNEKMYDKYFGNGNNGSNSNVQRSGAFPTTFSDARGNMPVVLPTSSPNTQMFNRTPSFNDDMYRYNWSPEDEQQQFREDFGLIYQ